MSEDFENDLRRLLNEHVDARTGPRQAAPAFDPDRGRTQPAATRRVRTRWLPPLLAAACIAVLVGGGVATSQLLSSNRNPAGPVTPAPRPTSSGPTPTSAPTPTTAGPTPTHVPSTSAPSHTAAAPGGGSGSSSRTESSDTHVVELEDASIALPDGWVVRDLQEYSSTGGPLQGFCLTPASEPVRRNGPCPISFGQPPVLGNALDVDMEGGFNANPHGCFQSPRRNISAENGERTFGGRAADWRRWHYVCDGKTPYYVEQYVVPTGPAYILSSEVHTDEYHDAITEIAQNSTLPAQKDPLRWTDTGFIRSIHKDGKYVRITLDRAYEGGTVNKNPATYPYKIPLSLWDNKAKVGDYYRVRTDGRRVIEW